MALATERLIVPISAEDKKRIERKAARAGQSSTAEYVRQAALNFEPVEESEAAELRDPLNQFETLHANVLAQLDRTDAALDRTLAHFAARHG